MTKSSMKKKIFVTSEQKLEYLKLMEPRMGSVC
jgi:hypothetical protein